MLSPGLQPMKTASVLKIPFQLTLTRTQMIFSDRKVSDVPLSVHPSICSKLFTFLTSAEPLHAYPLTYHNCSSKGPEEMLYLFFQRLEIQDGCLLTDRIIFDILSRTTTGEICRLNRNVPLEVLKKCCFRAFQNPSWPPGI